MFGYSLAMPLEELSCKSQKNLMQRVAKACNERFRRTAPQPLKALFGFLFAPKRSPVLARLWRWVGREPFELKDLAHRSILFMSLLCWTCWMYPFNLALPWIAIAVRLSLVSGGFHGETDFSLFAGPYLLRLPAPPFPIRGCWQREDEVDIIVNKANPVNELSLADARNIFIGDKGSWPNGKRITVLMLAAGATLSAPFCCATSIKWANPTTASISCRPPSRAKSKPPQGRRVGGRRSSRLSPPTLAPSATSRAADADDTVKVVLKIP